MKHYTYITTNLINNKKYIGDHSTDNPMDTYMGSGILILQALKKYGRENFKKEILEEFDTKQEAFNAQEKYINKFNTLVPNGYNISPSGGLNCGGLHSEESKELIKEKRKLQKVSKGWKHSEESKELIKEKRKLQKVSKGWKHSEASKQKCGESNIGNKYRVGYKMSDETKLKLKKINTGNKHSDETKSKISNSSKGRILSEESKKKIGLSKKGKPLSKEHREKLRIAKLKKSNKYE